MKKSKTIKSISKRFKLTKSGKVKKIRQGQNHFNAKDTGKKTRNKRQDLTLAKSDAKIIKSLIK